MTQSLYTPKKTRFRRKVETLCGCCAMLRKSMPTKTQRTPTAQTHSTQENPTNLGPHFCAVRGRLWLFTCEIARHLECRAFVEPQMSHTTKKTHLCDLAPGASCVLFKPPHRLAQHPKFQDAVNCDPCVYAFCHPTPKAFSYRRFAISAPSNSPKVAPPSARVRFALCALPQTKPLRSTKLG